MKRKLTFLTGFLLLLLAETSAQQNINGSFIHGGLLRTYRVYIPASASATVPAPLVINLHGYGSNNIEQELYTNFKPIADTAGFILVHPNGTPDFSNTMHWNAFGTSNVDDVGFLSALTDTLSTFLNINQSRVYVTGMSNGGFMSFQLACQLGGRIAAVASVTGTMTNTNLATCQPPRPIPVMQIHGTADATVPYPGNFLFAPVQNLLNFWVGVNGTATVPQIVPLPDIDPDDGCTAELHTYGGGTNGSSVMHYKVIGGGHSWPGAPVNINITNMDFSASAEIWRFFRRYDLNGLIIGQNEMQAQNRPAILLRQFNGWIEATMPDNQIRKIHLFDLTGRLVYETVSSASTFRIAVANAGVYFLTTSDGLKRKFAVR